MFVRKVDEFPLRVIFLLLGISCFPGDALPQCARDTSRLVRSFARNEFLPLYKDYNVGIPYSCPLSHERDMFADQESHLLEEAPSRWTCNYCGKSFYAVHYIDMHFDNRHADKIRQTSDATCLADYCDTFRCDVLGTKKKPEFWKMALCKESHLVKLKRKCQDFLKSCIPDSLTGTQSWQKFRDALQAKTCAYITCDKYWEAAHSADTQSVIVPYIIAAVFMIFATILYYVAAYTHFYTDEPVLETLGLVDHRTCQQSEHFVPSEDDEISCRRRFIEHCANFQDMKEPVFYDDDGGCDYD